jgi:hypothetical protein
MESTNMATEPNRDPKPPLTGGASPELQVRIACAGRSVNDVLTQLHQGLCQALLENRDPLIVLEDLVLLKDSVSNLLKAVCREIVGYPRTVNFWESSGITEAFMSAMEVPPSPARRPPAAS